MSDGARNAEIERDDAESRRLAQQIFDRPFLLEAGAGTGKTTALVARVLAWVLGPGWEREVARRDRTEGGPGHPSPRPDRVAARLLGRVVAITFTEAAAAEMASRIDEALLEVERGGLPLGLLADGLPDTGERRERARALRGALDHLEVSTIHAYCRRLLAAHPLEAGLHPRLEVDAERRVQAGVVREVLETRLREAYAEPGETAFLWLAGRGFGPREIEAELLALLDEGVSARALSADPFAPARIAQLRERLRRGLEEVRGAAGGRLHGLSGVPTAVATAERVDRTLERLEVSPLSTRAELEGWIDWLRKEWEGRERKRLEDWGRDKFGQRELDGLGELAEGLRQPAAGLAELLASLSALDLDLFDAARPLFRDLLEQVEAQMRARGAITFSALLTEASELLSGNPGVASQVRSQIDQLLVDEFQDTDRRQCEIVRAIALRGPERERPGLFLVGDPKQSIYSWRSADLAAYDAFAKDIRSAGGVRRYLSVNHRSVPCILDEVERVIEPVMFECEGVQPAFQRLVAGEKHRGEPGFRGGHFAPVEYWVSVGWDGEQRAPLPGRAGDTAALEALALARDLRSLHEARKVAWKEIGVLFRSRGEWEIYLRALREAGVPFAVEGDRSYYQRREIIDASALVRCVLDPGDHLALLTWIRSIAVGVPDAALIPLWSRGFPSQVSALDAPSPESLAGLRETIAEVSRSLPRDVPSLDRVPGWGENLSLAVEAIASLRRAFDLEPADAFVERLRTLPLLEAMEAARYLGPWRAANLDRFFRDLTCALADGGDAHAVLRRLRSAVSEEEEAEEGRPKEVVEDAVQVLTIHGAKGLDFSHVYLMQLHKGSGGRSSGKIQPGELGEGLEYRLLGAPTLSWDGVRRARERVEKAEQVRTLYVAMTRAKQRLVLAGLWPEFQERAGRDQHVKLLEERRVPPPDLVGSMRELAARGESDFADVALARWVFPALAKSDELGTPPAASSGVALPKAYEVAAASRAILAAREAARERMKRPLGAAASAEAHEDWAERRAARGIGEEVSSGRASADAEAEVARSVGTAIHRALEGIDLAADPAAAIDRARGELESGLRFTARPEAFEAALGRARALLDRFAAGPLFARLRDLAAHLVARELPVLVAPEGETGAVGFVSGAIDLVYRDPESGELVVVDYKTDRLEGEAAFEQRARAYAEQGAVYQRALREAFDLAYLPRFELWFLDGDRIELTPVDS